MRAISQKRIAARCVLIRESADKVRTGISDKINEIFRSEQKKKKPLVSQGLKDGAGEEGRTPDLMLGKHTL